MCWCVHQEKRYFGLMFSTFFEQDCLLFARVDIGMTEFPTTIAEKEEETNWVFGFYFQKWACASRFQWPEFSFFGPARKDYLGGGYNFRAG